MTNPNDYDPLADTDKAPSISWADLPVGTVQTLDVSEPCGPPIHYKDYDTQEPMYWQPKGRPSATVTDKPVQQVVYNGLDKDGEAASLFVRIKGEQLFYKLAAAQKAYGKRLGASDTVDRISIRLDGRVNADGKKQNQFSVKIAAVGPKPEKPAEPFDDGFGTPAEPAGDPWGSAPAGDEPPF